MYAPLDNWSDRDARVTRRGYMAVWVPEHPRSFCGGWVLEHRLVMERHKGRILNGKETVHHINENKLMNTLDNLFVCTEAEHIKAHARALCA